MQPEPRSTMRHRRALVSALENPATSVHVLRTASATTDARELGLIVEHPNSGDALVREIAVRHAGDADVLLRALRNSRITDSLFDEIAAGICPQFHDIVDELRARRAH